MLEWRYNLSKKTKGEKMMIKSVEEYNSKIKRIIITEEEISKNSEYANKLLDVSNNIIVFDLLNENNDR